MMRKITFTPPAELKRIAFDPSNSSTTTTTTSTKKSKYWKNLLRTYRFNILLGIGLLACLSMTVKWAGSHVEKAIAKLHMHEHHIKYFDKGETGYLAEHYCIDNSKREECCTPEHCATIVKHSTLYSECCANLPQPPDSYMGRSKVLPLLITSAPRSGTKFIQQLFTRVGLQGLTTDERSPEHSGTVSWKHIFFEGKEPYTVSSNHVHEKRPVSHLYESKFRVIWHLVRDPLQSLTSLAYTEPLWEDTAQSRHYIKYISKHVPLSNATTLCQALDISPEEWNHRINMTQQSAVAMAAALDSDPAHVVVTKEKLNRFLVARAMEIYLYWHGFINHLNVPIFRLEDLSVQKNVTILDEVFASVGMTPPKHDDVLAFLHYNHVYNNNNNRGRQLLEAAEVEPRPHHPSPRRRQLRGVNHEGNNMWNMELHKNARYHRETLDWKELCKVDHEKAQTFLTMSQSFGYYMHLQVDSLCLNY